MPSPFFILGSGRCGSTYLLTLLEKHPHIALSNEAHAFDFLWFCSEYASLPTYQRRTFELHATVELHGLVNVDYTATFAQVFTRHAKAIAEDFYATHFKDKAFRRWGDKLPDPRAALAARELWPDTAYIVLVRDPRDVLCSFRKFAESGGATIKEHLPQWGQRAADDFCVEYRSLYGHGLGFVPGHLLVRYEDLVRDPLTELRRCLEHLGLSNDTVHTADLQKSALFSQHGTSTSAQASIGRWRNDLPAEDVAVIARELGDLLQHFGYDSA